MRGGRKTRVDWVHNEVYNVRIQQRATEEVRRLPRKRKNVYIAEADAELWEEAERLAERREAGARSVSSLLTELLGRYVEEEKRKERIMQEDMETIEVLIGTSIYTGRRVQFVGRWLVEPDQDGTRPDDPAGQDGFYYGVALTRRGNIAVYIDSTKPSESAQLETYPSLDAAAVEGLPEDIYERAEAAMGPDHVQHLDI
jgi:hypothetical protein